MRNAETAAVNASDEPRDRSAVNRDAARTRPRLHPVIAITLVAFLARIVSAAVIRPWPVAHNPEFWKLGFEIVNIATSIVTHHGFSSPFGIPSGPTAWIAPVYPYLLATIFSLTGLRSNLAAATIMTMQSLISALTCIPLYGIAKKAFDERTARWSAWGWALFPYAVLIPVLFIWETTLSAFLLTTLCYLCMDLPNKTIKGHLAIGALWGLAALTNPSLLAVMPFFILWPYAPRVTRRSLRAAAIMVAACGLIVAPWIYRDWLALHRLVPVRSNFGEELWQGNHEGGNGRIMYKAGPAENERERERYRQLGEIAYLAQQQEASATFIVQHPDTYLKWTFFRFRYWWYAEGESAPVFYFYRIMTLMAAAGIVFVWRTGTRGADLPIIVLLVFPLVYYVTDVYARYRHPIEPFMMLLGTFAALQCVDAIQPKARNTSNR